MTKFLKIFLLSFLSAILFLAIIAEIKYINGKYNPVIYKVCIPQTKPSYETLKSRTVFIRGCTKENPEELSLLLPVIKDDENGFCWGGTGVVIKITEDETYILSNAHVIGRNTVKPTIFIENTNESDRIQAEIIKYHPYDDLAVVKIRGHLKDKTALTKITSIKIQDPIYIVGHPLAVRFIYTEGVMAGYVDSSLLIQAPCIYGNSGSGLWDKDGNLVGLVYALQMFNGFLGIPMPQITHAVAVNDIAIQQFLKDLNLYE